MSENSGILLIDKEAGMTSFDVCSRLQKVFFTRQIGHTGTLDPNATGLLIVLVNKATKILPYLKNDVKEYIAELRLGIHTDTGDIWGKSDCTAAVPELNEEMISDTLSSFLGKQFQTPPKYSAIKVKGRKLYEYARHQQEVEIQPREIEIYDMELLSLTKDGFVFRAVVSSGTYIRSLCEDIAVRLNTLGTMSSLRRIRISSFKVENALKLCDVSADTPLLDIAGILNLPLFEYENISDILNGRDIDIACNEERVLIRCQNTSLAVYQRRSEGRYHCERGLW